MFLGLGELVMLFVAFLFLFFCLFAVSVGLSVWASNRIYRARAVLSFDELELVAMHT